MSTPELVHTRKLVNGCLAFEWTQVSATSRGVGEATEFVALTLRAWGMPDLFVKDAETLTRWLIEWALGDRRYVERDKVVETPEGAMVEVGVTRHLGGFLVEIRDRMITPSGPRAPLDLPKPFGSRWLRDADRRPLHVLWCGILLPR